MIDMYNYFIIPTCKYSYSFVYYLIDPSYFILLIEL